MLKRNLWILFAVIALAILPLVIHHGGDAEFTGADGLAEAVITEIQPDYKPWASPLWEPPSGEIESLLFALQAAIGAGLVGFYFGRRTSPAKTMDPK
ncbi:energy-coupling factor ABC transporter substrate-binding protein (plasmid) [Rhizobium sp. 32-5/1]|uniref:energy-coupling factor ABC transporter substrate-binding protein n=1 Tax=Rhizobium sp. 32-5/1 TaxID=3019602 RepID=UPI00240DDEA1|nr:energy-coupling factor ABC transporter substrate-binding protein [Rhizobium sp. 32-5/1]WEZ85927.1 energy-coupling factor ABC transporter substrate-binding protein [Rhizobium sp. 32-5/1]